MNNAPLYRLLRLLVLALGVCSVAVAAPVKVTQVEGVSEYRLDNGLRILLAPDLTRSATTVNITYLVGSRQEGYGETGMAHLLEHMLFKGTPTHPDIPAQFTRRGMRSNGSTWYDRTNYFETFSASDEALEWALAMEADRMVNSFVSRKDLDSEMTVVRNELERAENDSGRVLGAMMLSAAYRWHNYGKATLGARADVENVGIPALQAFYRKYYRPDNAVLLVAGKFDTPRTLALIDRYFAPLARPAVGLPPSYTVEPPQEGERSVQLARVGANRMVAALYHVPPAMHADTLPLHVVAEVLTATATGRLNKALVQGGKATEVWAWTPTLYEPGFMIFGADMRKEDKPADTRKLLLDIVEGLGQKPITNEEFEHARTNLQSRQENTLKDLNSFGIGLSEYIAAGDWRLFFLRGQQLAQLKLEDVNRVAPTYFKPYNRTVGELVPIEVPARVVVPGRADFGEAFKALPAESSIAAGEDFDTSAANILARTVQARLPNGLELAMLPKKSRAGAVQMEFMLRFGDANNSRGLGTTANLAAAMLLNGTKNKKRADIFAELERLNTRVSTRQAGQSIIIGLDSRRDRLPDALSLVRELLLEPTFPSDELSRLVRQRVAAAREHAFDPGTLATRVLARHVTPYPSDDLRYALDETELSTAAEKLDSDDLAAFWRDYVGGDHAYVAAVGDFDADELTGLMTKHFSAWTSRQAYAPLPEPWQDIAAMARNIETRDKQNASLQGAIRIPVGERSADYPAMLVATHLLGGGFLSSRLATRIRQKEGLSYGVGARLTSSSGTPNSVFYVSASYAPQNRPRIEAALREELQRVFAEGFSEAELADAKNALLEARRLARAQDASLAAQLAYNLRVKRSFAYAAELDAKLAGLTLEQLNTAVRRHLDPQRLSIVFAGDFAAQGAASPAP